jgi:hypothetical protein
MQVSGRGCNEFLCYCRAVILTVADAVFLPSPRHVLARGGRRAGLAPDRRTGTGMLGREAGAGARPGWCAGACVRARGRARAHARAGEGGQTVDSPTFKSVEISKDMVILLHDRLTAFHIECLKLHMVNLFTVGVVFKEGDHNVSEIVAQVLAVFLHHFLKFLQECEFSVRPIFLATCCSPHDS